MRAIILYIIAFFVILFAFFTEPKQQETFESLEGISFNAFTSTEPTVSARTTEIILFKEQTEREPAQNFPAFDIFSELALPDKFVASVVTSQANADFVLVSSVPLSGAGRQPEAAKLKSTTSAKTHKKPTAPKKPKAPTPAKKKPALASVVKKEQKEIQYNYYILNNIVKDSSKTYFFPLTEQNLRNVIIRIHSVTPYQDKHILKFQIANAQREYFFIANLALYEDLELTPAVFYNDPLVAPDQTMDCVALIPRTRQTQFTLKLIESGLRERMFALSFVTP